MEAPVLEIMDSSRNPCRAITVVKNWMNPCSKKTHENYMQTANRRKWGGKRMKQRKKCI
jgi:hypothetical protein